jgi:hypothetical protein
MKKTSDIIKEIRAIRVINPPDEIISGEKIPHIYEAHMSAIETERQRDMARCLVSELFGLLEGSVEGPGVTSEREDEINGLLLLWGLRSQPSTLNSQP